MHYHYDKSRNMRNDILSNKVVMEKEKPHFVKVVDDYNMRQSYRDGIRMFLWGRFSSRFHRCIFNWHTNVQLATLALAWMAIVVAHVALVVFLRARGIASTNLRLIYLLGPSVFLLALSFMRVLMFDIHLSLNSLCKTKVVEMIPEMRLSIYENGNGAIPFGREDCTTFRATPPIFDVLLIGSAVLFAVSSVGICVLEYLNSRFTLEKKPLLMECLGGTLLGGIAGSIIGITALLLYRNQINQISKVDEVQGVYQRKEQHF